jgi:hypothetical protein
MVGLRVYRNNFGLPKFCCEEGNFFFALRTIGAQVNLIRNCRKVPRCERVLTIVVNTYAWRRTTDTPGQDSY